MRALEISKGFALVLALAVVIVPMLKCAGEISWSWTVVIGVSLAAAVSSFGLLAFAARIAANV